MKRLILAALLPLVLLSACGDNTRLGIVTPPERTVNYDPSSVDGGLAAPVGFQVNSALGDKSWTKFGTTNSAWLPVPGATVAYSLSVDATQPATTDMGVIVPGIAGYSFTVTRYSSTVIAVTGTASGTAPAYSWGNVSPNYTDGQATASALSVALINEGPRAYGGQNAVGSNAQPGASGLPIHVKIVTAVTGATVCTFYVTLIGFWLPIS